MAGSMRGKLLIDGEGRAKFIFNLKEPVTCGGCKKKLGTFCFVCENCKNAFCYDCARDFKTCRCYTRPEFSQGLDHTFFRADIEGGVR